MSKLQELTQGCEGIDEKTGSQWRETIRKYIQRDRNCEFPRKWPDAVRPLFNFLRYPAEKAKKIETTLAVVEKESTYLRNKDKRDARHRGRELARIQVGASFFCLRYPFTSGAENNEKEFAKALSEYVAHKRVPIEAWIQEVEIGAQREVNLNESHDDVAEKWAQILTGGSAPTGWQSSVKSYFLFVDKALNQRTPLVQKVDLFDENRTLGFALALFFRQQRGSDVSTIAAQNVPLKHKKLLTDIEQVMTICGNRRLPTDDTNGNVEAFFANILTETRISHPQKKLRDGQTRMHVKTLEYRLQFIKKAIEAFSEVQVTIDNNHTFFAMPLHSTWISRVEKNVVPPFLMQALYDSVLNPGGWLRDGEENYPKLTQSEQIVLLHAAFMVGGVAGLMFCVLGISTCLRNEELDRLIANPTKYLWSDNILHYNNTDLITKTEMPAEANDPPASLITRVILRNYQVEEPSSVFFNPNPSADSEGSLRKHWLLNSQRDDDWQRDAVLAYNDSMPPGFEVVDMSAFHQRCFRGTGLTNLCMAGDSENFNKSSIYVAQERAAHATTVMCATRYARVAHKDRGTLPIDEYFHVPEMDFRRPDGSLAELGSQMYLTDAWLLYAVHELLRNSGNEIEMRKFMTHVSRELAPDIVRQKKARKKLIF